MLTHDRDIVSKKDWYKTNWEHYAPVVQLIELSIEEKNILGYDAILVTWYKLKVSNSLRKRLIKQLQKE